MTDKERLVELMKKGYETVPVGGFVYEGISDYLLANGVIVPPCKVGDTVYFLLYDVISGETYIDSQQINDVCTRGIFVSDSTLEENCGSFELYSSFGETAFLTREEAEKALAERSLNYEQNS